MATPSWSAADGDSNQGPAVNSRLLWCCPDDTKYVGAGVLLTGTGAAARAAIDTWRPERDELWVQRSANR
jgi:hypothetical protein